MALPLSMLLGPLAKAGGLNVPSASELWQNRVRGPVGSPAYYAQQNLERPEDKQIDIAPTNTPFGIQTSDPAYWQMPYRDPTKRSKQAWGAPVEGLLVESPYTGHTAEVPTALQPQEPNAVAKFLGAPGVPSGSGFDSRGDASKYADNRGRKETIFQAAANPNKAVNVKEGKTTSFYQPGNEQVGTVNLVAKEGPDTNKGQGGK